MENYFDWSETAFLKIKQNNDDVTISGNAEALRYLGEYCLRLGESTTPGAHMHLDEFLGVEPGLVELVIEKIDGWNVRQRS